MYDVVIKNGEVVDGSGREPFQADVAIEGDRIVAVERSIPADKAKQTIDATGKLITPGFVDPHSHADLTIIRDDHEELLKPLVKQGITTFVGGNCGMGVAPFDGDHKDAAQLYVETFTAAEVEELIKWRTFGQMREMLERRGMVMNGAFLVPHGILRLLTTGLARRLARETELRKMMDLLAQALDEGAVGLSTGLQYFPGMFADTNELLRLGKVLRKYDATYTSHLRSYTTTLPLAIEEAAHIAQQNEIRAQVSHIMLVPELGPIMPFFQKTLKLIAKASKRLGTAPLPLEKGLGSILERIRRKFGIVGREFTYDVMPTTAGFTHALAFFPPWVFEGSVEDMIKRLADPDTRKKIYYYITHGRNRWPHREDIDWNLNYFKLLGFEGFYIMSVVSQKNKHLEGKSLAELGRIRKKHPFDALCDLLLEEKGHVLLFGTLTELGDPNMERSVQAAILDPDIAISTDSILLGFGYPSELFYGCYPHFFEKYVRKGKKLSWGVAVRKTTGIPADIFKLPGRGYVRPGYFADIVVLDPNTIGSKATLLNPKVDPTGIEHVFINGKHVVENGRFVSGLKAGRVVARRS